MKAPNLHLNLLHASERQSSSPVRLRVMLPIFALLACLGCLVWWGVLAGQLMIAKAQNDSIQQDIAAKKAVHGGILQQMASEREMRAELDQLTMYAHGRRTYGDLFRRFAESVPEGVQLLALEIPEPPVPTVKPLLGPTNTVEAVALRVIGRTLKEKPVEELMKTLEGPAFTNALVIAKKVPAAQVSPRIRSFHQESTSSGEGERLLAFDIEYRCVERRFEK